MTYSIFKIFIIVISALVILNVIKTLKSPAAYLLTVAVCLLILFFSVAQIMPLIDFITVLSEKAGIDDSYLKIILKCIGICLLGEVTSQLCRDTGENSLAVNVELAGKVSILLVALPMYSDIFNLVLKLWERS